MTHLYKVSGGGNDFLALVEPARNPTAEEIVRWCARGLSLGADGVFVVRRKDAGVAMEYWNSDGLPAALCINGTRCAARLAFALHWATDEVVVETGAGSFGARPSGASAIALELPAPDSLPRQRIVQIDGRALEGWFVTIGVPHFVVPWEKSLSDCPVASLGAALRRHPSFGAPGTNVDFVRYSSKHRMEIRSFERGVEAETLACGTGVLASTAVGLQLNLAHLPLRVLTRGGFELDVDGETVDSAPSRWSLAGDARILGKIDLLPDADVEPPSPPDWKST